MGRHQPVKGLTDVVRLPEVTVKSAETATNFKLMPMSPARFYAESETSRLTSRYEAVFTSHLRMKLESLLLDSLPEDRPRQDSLAPSLEYLTSTPHSRLSTASQSTTSISWPYYWRLGALLDHACHGFVPGEILMLGYNPSRNLRALQHGPMWHSAKQLYPELDPSTNVGYDVVDGNQPVSDFEKHPSSVHRTTNSLESSITNFHLLVPKDFDPVQAHRIVWACFFRSRLTFSIGYAN